MQILFIKLNIHNIAFMSNNILRYELILIYDQKAFVCMNYITLIYACGMIYTIYSVFLFFHLKFCQHTASMFANPYISRTH